MRKILIASMAAAAFSLTACSEKTQDAAGETADAMAEDVAATGDAMAEGAADAADATAEAAAGAGNAVEGTVNAAGDAAAAAGDKIKEETAKAEANDKK
ncbi:MAG: entericidin EcnAB [Sphingopyxis sp.]|nr:entericidin EcnAB [Sphingopyxis sp.]